MLIIQGVGPVLKIISLSKWHNETYPPFFRLGSVGFSLFFENVMWNSMLWKKYSNDVKFKALRTLKKQSKQMLLSGKYSIIIPERKHEVSVNIHLLLYICI